MRKLTKAQRIKTLDFPVTESGCIEFDGYMDKDGYGTVFDSGRQLRAHLVLGTVRDNTNDKVSRNRQQRGEKHPNSKLSTTQVLKILELGRSGVKHKDIAKHFGVTRANVSYILSGTAWAHVSKEGDK